MAAADDKADVTRLREMALHRGMKLVTSRRRKPGGDFGKFGLKSASNDEPCLGISDDGLEASAEDIEAYLRGGGAQRWKSSLTDESPPPKRGARQKPPAEATNPRKAAARPEAKPAPVKKPKEAQAKVTAPEVSAPTLKVRAAAAGDASALTELLGDLGEPVERAWIEHSIGEHAERGEPILVAEIGALIGLVAYQAIFLPHRSQPLGRITLLGVAESERRRGVGRALAQAAFARLEARGCEPIEMVGGVDFGEIGRFARAVGFKGRDYRFVRRGSSGED